MKFVTIFIIVFIIVQFLTYNLARVMMWQFNIRQQRIRQWLLSTLFLFTNGLFLVHSLRIVKIFRFTANWLVILWFVFMTTAIIVILAKILRKTQRYQNNADWLNRDLRIISPVILIGLFAWGLYNAYTPIVKHVTIEIDKPLVKPIRIGMAADLHLGVLVGAKQLDKLANIMNQEKVDMILLAGDIMDDDTVAYHAENMKPHLQKLQAPLGVYATLGNHDFGQRSSIIQEIKSANITVLYDDVLKIDNRIWLIGRPDSLDHQRAQTADLLTQANVAEPVFLIDHRPDEIDIHAHLPIDLQVSGHVHNGQIFPLNLIVYALNRISYGYEKINHGHFVVTSGFGFWGIPFRLASQSEVWIIDVRSKR